MRQTPGRCESPAEKHVQVIWRQTRFNIAAEENIRILPIGLRDDYPIAEPTV